MAILTADKASGQSILLAKNKMGTFRLAISGCCTRMSNSSFTTTEQEYKAGLRLFVMGNRYNTHLVAFGHWSRWQKQCLGISWNDVPRGCDIYQHRTCRMLWIGFPGLRRGQISGLGFGHWNLVGRLTLEPFHVESNCGHDDRGLFVGLLKVVDNGGLAAVVEADDEDVHLLLLHLQHRGQFVEEAHDGGQIESKPVKQKSLDEDSLDCCLYAIKIGNPLPWKWVEE